MTAISYPYNLLRGLSDFWQRFFADADQLEALYQGSAMLMGQAYLDLMSATLGVSLKDAVAIDREYYRLVTLREDELRFVKGATLDDDRWAFELPDPLVSFVSLDNRVFEPTASLEEQRDYDVDDVDRVILFKADPTDPTGAGVPLDGYARRALDVDTGGKFTDASITNWLTAGIKKGDTLRILDVGTDGTQRKREDHAIAVVRANGIYVDAESNLPAPSTGVKYVVLRVPPTSEALESFTLVASEATFAHSRVDQGSLRVFARNASGADVVEGVDYLINYEAGKITQIGGTPWQGDPGPFGVAYTWQSEIQFGVIGVIASTDVTTRVIQIATWAPDARVDRRTLANNFGSLVEREADSSEAYRAFLQGIFQLYVLGPVLERVESALNVVLNLPVVREDGEVVQSIDTSDPLVDRVLTTRPSTGQTVTYEFPKGTPLRGDLVAGLELLSFEPLTTAVTVTDYVQTPNWWHNAVIPTELFSPVNGNVPIIGRRTSSAAYVAHVVGAADEPEVGDPGLYVGGDETGFVPAPGHPVFRRRMAFVLMDLYLKHHTFTVTFDAAAVSSSAGSAFEQSIRDLNELVLASRPSHTFAFTRPETFFRDEVQIIEDTLSFNRVVGSSVFGPDQVIFADEGVFIGAGVWVAGDYFKYELATNSTAFPALATPVTIAGAPVAPRHGRFVRIYVAATIGGKRVIENVDYSVDYAARQVSRLTAWDSTTANVTYVQLNIGNVADAPASADDMPVIVGNIDPALITAIFDPAAAQWDGTVTPITAPRDIGLVERALIVHAHP